MTSVPIRAGDVLSDVFELKFEDRVVIAHRTAQRVDLRDPDIEEPFGSVRLGTPNAESGSIWLGRDVIGEFELVNNEFVITPISSGRLDVDTKVRAHPIEYLVRQAIAAGRL